jgi:tetratricopeptide (TPR) repeat protein
MLTFIFLAGAAYFVYRQLGGAPVLRMDRKINTSVSSKIEELSEYAYRLRSSNKFMAAEKVYLQILNLDHKHSPTYSRLGSLYIMMKNYPDALECLQIASQLSPSATTYFNLGLGFYENQNYIKATATFEKSIMFEPSVQRYIGAAKAYQKLSNHAKAINVLELAVEIEANERTLSLLAGAFKSAGRNNEAELVCERLKEIAPAKTKRQNKGPLTKVRPAKLEKTRL